MPFWVPTLRGKERLREKPGDRSEEGKVRRLPPCVYTQQSQHSQISNGQEWSGIFLESKSTNDNLRSKEDTHVLDILMESVGFQKLFR